MNQRKLSPLYLAALAVALPVAAAQANEISGYGTSTEVSTTIHTDGSMTQTSTEQTWVNGSAAQRPAEWYQSNLAEGKRYVYNPATDKLELMENHPQLLELNRKAQH